MNQKTDKSREDLKIENYRDLINYTTSRYPDNIAYKYKKSIKRNMKQEDIEYVNVTYSEFKKDIETLGTALLNLGLENKKVALIGDNSYMWCVSYLAITTSNIVVVPLDKVLPEAEIENLIEKSGAEAVICNKKYIQTFNNIKNNPMCKLTHLISMEKTQEKGIIQYSDLMKKGKELLKNNDKTYENMKIDKDKMSILLFTSGTTNKPKGVMLSQNNICSNIEAIGKYVKMYPTDTLLSFLPIHHTFECTITFLYGIYFGVTVAFCDGLKYLAQNLKEYKVSVFVAVPLVLENMYKKIQKGIEDSGKEKLINTIKKVSNMLLKCGIDIRKKVFKSILDNFGGNLRIVFYGAAPMNKEYILGYNDLGIKLLQGYGLTETSPVICCETDDKQKPGSIGLALKNLEVKIENKNEEGIGEITVKGPSVMQGYYEDSEKTQQALKEGVFYTGDYGYIDEKGFIYITGRKSDIIVLKNGKNIYPQEIEKLINLIPFVKESMIYSREIDSKDTIICAKIVYNEEYMKETFGDKTEKEYKEIIWKKVKEINRTLPIYKYVKEIQVTKEELSKTTTQKIKRYEELKTLNKV